MKIHQPSISGSYIGYVGWIQEQLMRKLSQKELKRAMECYINSINVEEALKEFEE